MVRQHLNKGFTLVEVLLVLFISHCCLYSGLAFANTQQQLFQAKQAQTIVTFYQYKAISQHRQYCVTSPLITSNDICFNAKGNVNQARSAYVKGVNQFKLIINLGAGKHYVE